MHLLPELSDYQKQVESAPELALLRFAENHIYLVAMTGLAFFYGLERLLKKSKKRSADSRASTGVFWVHIGSFFVYNVVIGYLLIRDEFDGWSGLFFYFLALSVHFVTNDRGLRREYASLYDRSGRFLLMGAPLIGWTIGYFMEVDDVLLSFLVGFLAGGIVLNVLKEELPEERESSFAAFCIGLVLYTGLLSL